MDFIFDLLHVAVGAIVSILFNEIRSAHGVLKIDQSDPEKDTYMFEIDDLNSLKKKKRAILKIDHNADLSQK